MINSIGSSATSLGGVNSQSGTQRSETVAKTSVPVAAQEDRGAVSTTSAQIVSAGAPVDTDRVSALRAAIKAGTYKADPQAIAGKMIASDLPAAL